MIGEHNVYDALAAIAVGRSLGVSSQKIAKALGSFKGMPMRQEIVSFGDFVVLNDAYNANPMSMAESIKAWDSSTVNEKLPCSVICWS